jgi:L-lactate dehydrogenase complex protein LldE
MPAKVSLFVTCLVDQLFPRIGLAMADVLERLGYEVDFPEAQTCCGQPAFNSGYRSEARKVARHFVQVFDGADYVVCPSGSCTSMVRHHYAELFHKDQEALDAARRIASRLYEFSEFVLRVAGREDVGAVYEGAVTYHDSCHSLRELGLREEPRRLLRAVRGLELREMDACDECCGFGGTFAVKFADVSGSMLGAKIEAIRRSGAGAVVSTDASCLMQIRGGLSRAGLPIRTLHLAEVLAAR